MEPHPAMPGCSDEHRGRTSFTVRGHPCTERRTMKRAKRERSFAGAVLLAVLSGAGGAWATAAGSGGTLHDAAAMNDTDAMAALIAGGADVDAGDHQGFSPLHWAAMHDSHEAAELLLANEAELDPIAVMKPDELGPVNSRFSPLKLAVARDSAEVALLLISRGAKLNLRWFESEDTLLHLAAVTNGHRIASALIAAGVDPNARMPKGSTPLHFAAMEASHGMAALLLDAGAEPDARDDALRTALHYAACQRTPDTGRLLIERGADVNARDERGLTPLHLAACRNAHETVAALLDAGADTDAADLDGRTALHMAARSNAHESAMLLVARGAEVEPPRREGVPSPLLAAVQCKAAEVALFLIGQGADLSVEDEAGATLPSLAEESGLHHVVLQLVERGEPLHDDYADPGALLRTAVEFDASRTVSLLLGRDVAVNGEDEYSGESLLHLAARHDSHEVVPLLIEGGIDADVRDSHGDTPLLEAAYGGAWEAALALIEHGAAVDVRGHRGVTPLHHAAFHDAWEAALALLDRGADVDAGDEDGRTPLHRAGAQRMVDLLLDRGAAADAPGGVKDMAGWTPLHYALLEHDAPRDLAVMLIERGAEVGAATALAGWTPLHLAAHLDDPAVVAALLARGAPVNARTRIGGWTPLHLARRQKGADEVVAMLRAAGAQDRAYDGAAAPPVYSHGRPRSYLDSNELYAIPSADFGAGGRLVAQGSFTAVGADERLVSESLGSAPYFGGDPAGAVGLIDESGTTHLLWITDDKYPFETLCRDPSTGLDHAIFKRLYGGSGNPGDIVHMYYDPERRTLVDGLVEVAYAERYEDGVSRFSSASPTPGGECRWRAKKAGIEALVEALDALRVGELAEWGVAGGEPVTLPTRVIPAPVAESLLGKLRETPAVPGSVSNGLVVRDLNPDGEWREEEPEWTVESPRWDIAVVSGARAGDYRYHDGVVLVRDKERGEWRSIHDCRRIDIRNVRGNTLFADFFDDCDIDGDDWTGLGRHHFKVDLLTWKAQRVKGWAPCEAPSTLEEWERCGEACPSSGACPATGGHDGIRLEKNWSEASPLWSPPEVKR